MEKILVAGGTGAMGVYLVPKLVARGYEVTVTHNDARLLERAQGANYIKTDM
ncbi:MAG: NAD-dependent epimerase/dehydratase family protein, partial [Lachnospiraceae bacterium]